MPKSCPFWDILHIIAYKDAAGNPTASKTQQVYTYDIVTETPSLTGPAEDSFIATNFLAAFQLVELALPGTELRLTHSSLSFQILMTPEWLC